MNFKALLCTCVLLWQQTWVYGAAIKDLQITVHAFHGSVAAFGESMQWHLLPIHKLTSLLHARALACARAEGSTKEVPSRFQPCIPQQRRVSSCCAAAPRRPLPPSLSPAMAILHVHFNPRLVAADFCGLQTHEAGYLPYLSCLRDIAMPTVKWTAKLFWRCSFEVKFGGLSCAVSFAGSGARCEVNAIALVVLSFIEVPRCQVDSNCVFHSSVVLSGAARAALPRCGCHWL